MLWIAVEPGVNAVERQAAMSKAIPIKKRALGFIFSSSSASSDLCLC
jgi:hypothetical protein